MTDCLLAAVKGGLINVLITNVLTANPLIVKHKKNKQSHNKFKNSDYWLILGDLNFRIETSFDSAFRMIQNKEYRDLIRYDQFYVYCKREKDLALAKEGEINFHPPINMCLALIII